MKLTKIQRDDYERWLERFRVGTGNSRIETIIRSGIWAEALTPAQRSILPVLDAFTEAGRNTVQISYRGIMRYSGVASQSTVASALKRFRQLRIIEANRNSTSLGLRPCSSYIWTLDDPEFLKMANDTSEKQRLEIQAQRDEQMLSVPETARALGYTLKYVYDLVYSGRIPATKTAGRWRIARSEIEDRLRKRGGQ